MMLFCCVGFAQDKEVMVVRQTDGKEVCCDVTMVKRVYVRTESVCVDLGLPSGLKWATCNLGAARPEEYGDYYGWGCTAPYAAGDDVNWTLYFKRVGGTGTGSSDCGTGKDPLKDYMNYVYHKSIAGTKWDAARKKLGGRWRMPTQEEVVELRNTDNCKWLWTMGNGVYGYRVTSKHNGNYIFLPAAGCRFDDSLIGAGSVGHYWTSETCPLESDSAESFYIHSDGFLWYDEERYIGFPIRPVTD